MSLEQDNKVNDYSEKSIRILKGLQPVKQRPGMYTLTDCPLHIIQEVIDNATDEVLANFANRIILTEHADGSISVEDNGRGIPVGIHPEEKVPVVEIVFTRLHAGGKFDKGAGGAYSFSGGLHGVGVSVTNALSSRLEVTVWRDGLESSITFEDGFVTVPLNSVKTPRPKKATGTRVRCWPDGKYFDTLTIPKNQLIRLLRSKAVLLPGCEVVYRNEKDNIEQVWKYEGGLKEYLTEQLDRPPLVQPFEAQGFAGADDDTFSQGEGAGWVVCWTDEGQLERESYVNLIPTILGMITTFSRIAEARSGVDMSLLAGGIWQALLTTAAGLCIAIPALFFLSCFQGKVRRVADALNKAGNAALLADGGPGITVRAGAEPLQPGDIPRGGGTAEGASCPESPEPRGSAPEGREAPQCRDNAGEGLPDGGRSC